MYTVLRPTIRSPSGLVNAVELEESAHGCAPNIRILGEARVGGLIINLPVFEQELLIREDRGHESVAVCRVVAPVHVRVYEEAINEYQKAIKSLGRTSPILAQLGHAYAMSGKRNEAITIVGELKEMSKQSFRDHTTQRSFTPDSATGTRLSSNSTRRMRKGAAG